MTANAEDILQKLQLPYRVMALSTGDMGFLLLKRMIWKYGFQHKKHIEKSVHVLIVKIFKHVEQ